MANVAIFRSGEAPRYLLSVHTPDYYLDSDTLVNPDISAVASVEPKYWKRVGDTIEEMTNIEKTALDTAERQAVVDSVVLEDDMKALLAVFPTVKFAITEADVLTEIQGNIPAVVPHG